MYEVRWEQVRPWLIDARDSFIAQLDKVHDQHTKVPGLDWDVRQLAAHAAAVPELILSMHDDADFQPPTDWSGFIAEPVAALDGRSLAELADAIHTASQALIDEIDRDPDARWFVYGQPTTAAKDGAGYLGELLIHGRDLAGVTGAEVPITPPQAMAAIDQYLTLGPAAVDRDRARRAAGTYGLHLRGGADYTITIDDTGTMTTKQGRPRRADARASAAPVDYLLVTLGRRSMARAALTGKMVGYGRRPWRLARLANIRADGV